MTASRTRPDGPRNRTTLRRAVALGVAASAIVLVADSFAHASTPPLSTDPTVESVAAPATSPPGTGGCPAPGNTPGGSDGRGGCFPGPQNTGVPDGTVLTPYTGPCTITVANTVIDSKIITCQLSIQANNVTIRNSHMTGGVGGMEADGASFRIEDSWIDNGVCVDCSVGGWNLTILRTEITGGNRGAYCSHCEIRDSWIHGTALDPNRPGIHASAVRVEQYATLIHNTLACDYTTPNDAVDIGCSATMTGYPDFVPITHNTIDGNLFIANPTAISYCAYGGATAGKEYSNDPNNATYIVFSNNVFQRGSNGACGAYGAVTDFDTSGTGNAWFNNRWDDGTTVVYG